MRTLASILLIAIFLGGCAYESNEPISAGARSEQEQLTPEEAREKLREMGIEYSEIAFLLRLRDRDTDVVKLFLKAGMSPDTVDSYRLLYGGGRDMSAFIYAVNRGYTEIAKAFIEAGADANARDEQVSFTVLMTAASHANTELVDALIRAGADVNAEAGAGWTPLIAAAIGGRVDGGDAFSGMMLDAVLGLKAEIEGGGSGGQRTSPSGRIDSQGSLEIVTTLIESGADVNSKMRHGETALMMAARKGRTEIVKTLLDNGADPNVKNMNGETALMYAARYKHTEAAQLLKDAGALK